MSRCKLCGKELSRDEIGLHKKLINKNAAEYMCLPCLAKYFAVSEESLQEKIRQFKEQGCLLFV